jgi:replicative DNA helicase
MIRDTSAHISEAYVLGVVLAFPEQAREEIGDITDTLFTAPAHRKIWKACALAQAAGRDTDFVTVIGILQERGVLDDVGGWDYVTQLMEMAVSPSELAGHLTQLKNAQTLRTLAAVAIDLRAKVDNPDVTVEQIVDHLSTRILEVAADAGSEGPKKTAHLTASALTLLDRLDQAPEGVLGATTGLPLLDYMTRGVQPGQLWYIGARPAVGKSSFALQMMLEQARRSQASTMFSLEMDAERLIHRLWARAGMIDIRQAHRTLTEKERLAAGMREIRDAPMRIDDARRGLSVSQMRARLASIHRSEPQQCAFLDYLGLLRLPDADRHDLRIGAASWALKGLARELGVGIVALTQLNRSTESRTDRKPQLSDLRDSGSLEQDADVVIFLHQPRADDPNTLELTVAKNREGPTGSVFLDVRRDVGTFIQIERPS